DWCRVRGLRTGENPFRWRGHLALAYPGKSKVRPVQHHAAVPIDGLPAVYTQLKASDGIAAAAVRFVILTAGRPGEIAGAEWGEFDMDARTWTVPGARMKAGREHVVPLSDEAVAVVKFM